MEENEIKNNAITHKNNSLNRLDLSFLKHIDLEEYKQTNLLAYWINDFANYHDNERTFDTTSLKTFKRGDIIKANLGYNIGNELGGLHYCVVINKNDNPYSNTLNIIPLSSKKDNKIYNEISCIDLGDELHSFLLNKYNNEIDLLENQILSIKNKKNTTEDIEILVQKLDYLKKAEKEIFRMKHGSIAYIQQITTISKQRIFKTPILANIKLSNNSLDLIDSRIKQLFTK